ncbi:MAG: hypothetical protein U0T74_11425 [Chitinophagales bacterium]
MDVYLSVVDSTFILDICSGRLTIGDDRLVLAMSPLRDPTED